MKITKQNIETFFTESSIAVVGASAKSKKFGNEAIKELVKKNYNVFSVHPSAETLEGVECYKSVADLPAEVGSIHVSVNKNKTNDIVAAAKQKGIKQIWVQQMSQNENTCKNSEEINIITGQCMIMHLEPVRGFHKFHRGINKLFGKLPK